MSRRLLFFYLLLFFSISSFAVDDSEINGDNAVANIDSTLQHNTFSRKIGRTFSKILERFTACDTSYVEPQHFKFQAMLQGIVNFEEYNIYPLDNYKISFSPNANVRIGPYVGYSLIFLGYTLQLNNLYLGNNKKNFNLSLYTPVLGCDIYYTSNDRFQVKTFINDDYLDNKKIVFNDNFDGLNVKSFGINTYIILNSRRHSYPAVYNQSTRQLKSSGSPLVGFGYGRYNVNMNWDRFVDFVNNNSSVHNIKDLTNQNLLNNIEYERYSLYGGYSYNYVIRKHLTWGISAMFAMSYNRGKEENVRLDHLFNNFSFNRFVIDGVGRTGIVWNNDRYFLGCLFKIDSNTYHVKSKFSINNTFSSFSFYTGLNFGSKKKYRKKGLLFQF